MFILTQEKRTELINFLKLNLNIPFDGMWARYYEEGCEDEDWYGEFAYECGADYIEHGASKAVLFYTEFPDIVVKIPFCGEYVEDEDSYKYFEGSNCIFPIDESNNYCAGEAYITQQAIVRGFEDMIAVTYYLCNVGETPIYISEKVPNSWWMNRRWKNKIYSLKIARDIYNQRRDIMLAEEVVAMFVDVYGKKRTYDFIDFLSEYRVSDLHNNNIGFTKTMKIKLIDYSGFDS